MRRVTARRARVFVRVLVVGALLGAAYGGYIGLTFGRNWLAGSLRGALDAATIAAVVAAAEILLSGSRAGRAVQRAPFLAVLGAKWLVYGAVITAVNVRDPGARLLGLPPTGPTAPPLVWLATSFSFLATFAFLFVLEVSRLVGIRTLRRVMLGRYHRPRSEERFFLFVDIVGSTALAERLGPAVVHRFLGRVFRAASDPVEEHGGEVYQYVGDEMVLTWTVAEGRAAARPLACFFAIVAALHEDARNFEREFGALPRLRGALHAGPVVTGEIGDLKRDIVFHGDVMNTTARLEQLARDVDRPFLASADALARLAGTEGYVLEPLGPRELRGRAAPVEVYAVLGERVSDPGAARPAGGGSCPSPS